MDEDTQFSEEGVAFSTVINEIMVMNMATSLVRDAQCSALLECLGDPPTIPHGRNAVTVGVLREFVGQKAREILDRKLASLAEDNHSLISAVRRLTEVFLPPTP